MAHLDILQLLTIGLLGLGSYLLVTFKAGTEAAVKRGAELGVEEAFEKLNWTEKLARELQKSRGLERQELRFKSYGALWKELRPLAIYDVAKPEIDNKSGRELVAKLSDWYFSDCGGLLLTAQSRDFYFALQDLLRIICSTYDNWKADRSGESEGEVESMVRDLFLARYPTEATGQRKTVREGGQGSAKASSDEEPVIEHPIDVLDYFKKSRPETWQEAPKKLGKVWRDAVKRLGADWSLLTEQQRFAVLQQVGSKLRTALVNDLESRER